MNVRAGNPKESVTTLCRMCDTRCGVHIHKKDGIIVDITPREAHPVNQGRMCPRGAAAIDLFYHPDRILKPLKKLSDGTFQEISREQALDEIAAKMLAIKKEHGARSVGVWKGEGVGFFQQEEYVRRFIHAFGSPNYFSNDSACYNGRYFGYSLVTGFWNPFPEFSEAGLILLFGTNPPMCHPPFMREFADARQNGAKLVVIDPRLNPIACYADIFAQPYPGTDGALGWGLIRYLIETKNYDSEFVDRYSIGFEKMAHYAKKFTPEYVEEQSGIYAHVVDDIAQLIIKSRPRVSIFPGSGLEHHENGVNNVRTLAALGCLIGSLDISCGLFWPEDLERRKLTLYDELPLLDQKPIGADKFPVLYELRKECHTMTAMDYMLGKGEYPLKGLIVTAANPAVTHPNTRKVEEALGNLELLVVNDFFLTPTAKLAHYVLPAATFLERSELHYNFKHHMVFLTEKVMGIPGVHGEYMLWHDLAHRLGFGEKYFPWPNEDEVNRWILEPTGIRLEDLRRHSGGYRYKPIRHKKYLTQPLPTPSGKVEFVSPYLKKLGLAEIPHYIPPYHLRHKRKEFPFVLTTGARKSLFYHSRHQNIQRFRTVHPTAEVEIHPQDAAALGIKDNEVIRVVSEMGSLEIPAKIVNAAELRQGVIEIYHGWEEWRVNFVTHDDINDPISGFPLLKGVPVRIEKI
ncbi:MAG: molybdopterin-dependent oxidoreductase [Desulfobacterales bacterium]|nr:MAG: molybdopterin-dependent oxidoreductase [Desulfobacterales bacterium]